MSWLYPLGLLGLLAVPVLVALSLWRRQRREVAVSSLLLWRDVAGESKDTPKSQRRRRVDPLLVLRVAVALLLTAALCGLSWLRTTPRRRTVVLVLDTSASMATRRPDGRTRWEACRDRLVDLVGRLSSGDRVVMVDVLGRLTHTALPAAAAQALREVAPLAASVPKDQLVAAATAERRSDEQAIVLVATDSPDLPGLPEGIHVVAAGGPTDNRGIVAFAARQRRDGAHEILVGIANASREASQSQVVLSADGVELGRQPIELPPRGRGQAIHEASLTDVAALEAALSTGDALAADDRAWLLRRTRPVRVALIGEPSQALRRALAAQDGVEVVEAAGTGEGRVAAEADLAVYYRAVPTAFDARRIVVVAPRADVGGLRLLGTAPAAAAAVEAARDPLMSAMTLDGVSVGRAARLTAPPGFDVLARAGAAPLIGRWREGAASVVYVGIDPALSDWPLTPSFPIFWANVVAEASGDVGRGSFGCSRPGDPGIPLQVGLLEVKTPDGGTRRVAASLLAEAETTTIGDDRSVGPAILGEGEPAGRAAVARRLTGGLALAGLALVVAHGWLAGRER